MSEVEGRLRAIWKAGLSPDTAWKSLSITLTKCIVMCADVLVINEEIVRKKRIFNVVLNFCVKPNSIGLTSKSTCYNQI